VIEAFKSLLRSKYPEMATDVLVDHLVECYHGPGTVYPGRMFPKEALTPQAADMLVAVGLLKRAWMLCYDDYEAGDAIDVSTEEAEEAFAVGEFYHPVTGKLVTDFRERLLSVLESAPVLDELAADRKR
jgi:hypothetical protein